MEFSDRVKTDLKRIIKKLDNDSFDEDDIKDLLLQWRANFNDLDLIWDIACFIAHPEERNQGVFHKHLDVKYTQVRHSNMIDDGVPKMNFNPNVIEAKVFNKLLIGGIDLTDSEHLKSKTGLTKLQAKNYLFSSYTKRNNSFEVKPQKNYDKLNKVINAVLSLIILRPSIKNEDIISQFTQAMIETISVLGLDYSGFELIKKNDDKIIICLMCLMHANNFVLIDKKKGSCELGVSALNSDGVKSWTLYLYARVPLGGGGKLGWPLMEFNNEISKYIKELPEEDDINKPFKLEAFNAIRNERGKLVLAVKE